MESMRDIRGRMTSVQKTMKITNAMYLMASSKLKRARTKLAEVQPYYDKLQYVMIDMLNHTQEGQDRYLATDRAIPAEELKNGYIIITSNTGLAGAYNQNVCRLAEEKLKETKNNQLCFIGLSGERWFRKKPQYGTILEEHCYSAQQPDIWLSRRIAEDMVDDFVHDRLDQLFVVYTRMVNAMTAEAECIRLLPLTRDMFPVTPMEDSRSYSTEYFPSAKAVLDRVVPNLIKGLLFGAMVEAFASEQNARMTAMKNATDNAEEIVRALQLQYNRVRQAAITTELNEVVAGANAQGSL